LLEAIKSLLEFVNMVRELVILKPFRLLNIDFFFEYSIQKCTLDIHLIQFDLEIAGTLSKIRIDSSRATRANVSSKSTPST
jgi:hypothetical protein